MMKFLLFSILFIFSNISYAYTCFLNGTEIQKNGTETIRLTIDSKIVEEPPNVVNEYANMMDYISCRNDEAFIATDWLYMNSFDIPPDSPPNVEFGVQIQGVQYFGQLPGQTEVFVIPMGNYGTIPLPLGLILKVTSVPNDGVLIRAGQELIRMHMHRFGWYHGTEPPTVTNPWDYTWVIVADNDIVLTSSSCTVNKNQPVEVDLGELYLRNIATTSGSKTNGQPLNITLECPDAPTYSGEVQILLAGDQSSFMNTALATRDGSAYGGGGNIIPDLGVEISGASTGAITPNATSSPVKAMINNGEGSAALMVTPVKNANATYLGDFNAVGTLIMSLP